MIKHVISSTRVPVKLWLDTIEDGALEQAKSVANLPFVFKHVAIMPDSHQGYGVPIGCVVATENCIIPNAIGVDIGCLDRDTEFLTRYGWKKISQYSDGDEVLQYDKHSGKSSFTKPLYYISKPCDYFYHFKNSKGADQMLCPDHKILVWKGYKSAGYSLDDMNPEELLSKKLDKGYYGFSASFEIDQTGINLTDNEIRLDIMLSADGCIRRKHNGKNVFEMHFKKKRKIERCKEILASCNVKFDMTNGKNDDVYFYFKLDDHFDKTLTKYYNANYNQLKIVADECLKWDGHEGYRSYYCSTIRENADVIQFAFSSTGIRAGIGCVTSKKDNYAETYVVTPTKNKIVSYPTHASKVKSEDGRKYCFGVESGYFVARRHGKVFIIGNCGMTFSPLGINLSDVTHNDLIEIVEEIKETIPVGKNHHKTKRSIGDFLEGFNSDATPIFNREKESAGYQIGTLGGGNHFIEIQMDFEGDLYVMIHSGSRNVGYKVATYYTNMAKELNDLWHSNVQKDLNFFPMKSTGGKAYKLEHDLCVIFARENRERMLNDVLSIIDKRYSSDTENRYMINIPHNYVTIEHHFGRNVLVHRKGATRVSSKTLGIIPGSQGTSSYIVKGMDNKESFYSCSHGAGRVMSRKKAREHLNIEDEQNKLNSSGVIHSISSEKDLDEAPSAYKDIDEVMENQKDLVSIELKLSPVAVIKG